ncbi:histidine phosphatase family protein [Phyllobacterium sp. SYP-B3895]|uniref:SixA phosphatase family protein n=1 Tax=Phyllobacterium sp. SYP-B3895 TaxID=2663240 RepID=UPI0012997399|nr:histidine phosphatase family protein [Phyllobacterium sp. SYP-B3895]MRG57123.1 histidine phosphatase family protein [Phyllobacterium sp. SYP-B3895]
MSQVFLLRHAKALWPSAGQKDFDRALDIAGIEAAKVVGEELKRSGFRPEIVLCSPAIRARQTLEYIALEPPFILEDAERLYSGGADGYLLSVRMAGLEHETANSVMLVGHNPMMEELAIALIDQAKSPAHPDLVSGFPTAGLAVISFDAPLAEINPGTGMLQAFFSPAEHHL